MSLLDEAQDLSLEIKPHFGIDGTLSTASVGDKDRSAVKELARQTMPTEKFGDFVPSTPQEASATRQGSASTAFGDSWDRGLIGRMLGYDDVSTLERNRLDAELQGYAERAPVSNFVVNMAASTLSDAPIDIAVGMAAGGIGAVVSKLARGAYKGSSVLRTIDNSFETIRSAYSAPLGSGTKTQMAIRGTTQFFEGAIAGGISEWHRSATELVTSDDVKKRMVEDGLGGAILHQAAIRPLGALYRSVKGGTAADDLRSNINSMLPKGQHIGTDEAKAILDQAGGGIRLSEDFRIIPYEEGAQIPDDSKFFGKIPADQSGSPKPDKPMLDEAGQLNESVSSAPLKDIVELKNEGKLSSAVSADTVDVATLAELEPHTKTRDGEDNMLSTVLVRIGGDETKIEIKKGRVTGEMTTRTEGEVEDKIFYVVNRDVSDTNVATLIYSLRSTEGDLDYKSSEWLQMLREYQIDAQGSIGKYPALQELEAFSPNDFGADSPAGIILSSVAEDLGLDPTKNSSLEVLNALYRETSMKLLETPASSGRIKPTKSKHIVEIGPDGRPRFNPTNSEGVLRGTVGDLIDDIEADDLLRNSVLGQSILLIRDKLGQSKVALDQFYKTPIRRIEADRVNTLGSYRRERIWSSTSDNARNLFNEAGTESTVKLKPELTGEQLLRVVSHELNHAATVHSIDDNVRVGSGGKVTDSRSLSPDELVNATSGHVNELAKIYRSLLDLLPEEGSIEKDYWREDITEFVAEAYSNKDFRSRLNNLKIKDDSTTSFLDKLLGALGKVLGLNKAQEVSVLRKTMDLTDGLVDDLTRNVEASAKVDKTTAPTTTPLESEMREVEMSDSPDADAPDAKTQKEIDAEAKKLKREAKAKAIKEARDKQDAEQRSLLSRAVSEVTGWATGGSAAKTKNGFKVLSSSQFLSPTFSTDNRFLASMLGSMGTAGKELKALVVKSTQKVHELKGHMHPHLLEAEKVYNRNAHIMKGDHEVELETAVFKDGNQVGTKVVKIKMTGNALTDLYMKAMDGLTDDPDAPTMRRGAAFKDLKKEDGGFVFNGNRYVLSDAQVEILQAGVGVPDVVKDVAESLWIMYRSAVNPSNEVAVELNGAPVFSKSHIYYSPSKKTAGDTDVGYIDFMSAALNGKSNAPLIASLLNKRTGGGAHDLMNPMAKARQYYEGASSAIGQAELTAKFERVIKSTDSRNLIKKHYGANWLDTLDSYHKMMTGRFDRQKVSPIASKMIAFRAMAMLGWNPSVMLKQAGSSWSAEATGLLSESGLTIANRAKGYLTKKSRSRIVSEASKHSPYFNIRKAEGQVGHDMVQIAESMNITVDELSGMSPDMVKKKLDSLGHKVSTKYVELVQRGMNGIRNIDEATVASIWESSKNTIRERGMKTSDEGFFGEVDKLFTEVMVTSQPTSSSPLLRNINQNRRGVFARMISQFTGQTAHNYGLAMNAVTEFANTPVRTTDHAKILVKQVMPLLLQTAYITSVSVMMKEATNYVSEEFLFGDSNKRTRMEKKFDNIFKRYAAQYVKDVFGQIPASGQVISAAVGSLYGAPVYDMSVPIASELLGAAAGVANNSPHVVAKNITTLLGTPQTPIKVLGL